jgi:Cys-tRNA(Pro) deacylase
MARKEHAPETPATSYLRQNNVSFTEHLYHYVEHGGTAESARQLGVDEHAVVKTLVMQDQDAKPLIILMHGDRQVSLKNFARQTGAKKWSPVSRKLLNATPATRLAALLRLAHANFYPSMSSAASLRFH